MTYCRLIIIPGVALIILIILYFVFSKNADDVTEGFQCSYDDINVRQLGYEEGLPPEYRKVKRCYRPIKNMNRLNSLMAETRNPLLTKVRNTYIDKPFPCGVNNMDLKDYALLRELPQELRNRYYGVVTQEEADNNIQYQPDDTCLAYKDVHVWDGCKCEKRDDPIGVKRLIGYNYYDKDDPVISAGEGTKDNYSDVKPYF